MKQGVLCASLFAAGCAVAPPSPQDVPPETHSAVVATVGERHFTDDLFDDGGVDDQTGLGLAYEWEMGQVVWELGILGSDEDHHINDPVFGSIKVDSTVTEAYLGARHAFRVGVSPVRPYVGGGLSFVKAKFDLDAMGASADDDDTSPGLYLHAGADWFLSESFFLGLDFRVLTGTDLEVFDTDTDADYEQLALRVGYSF